VTVILVSATTLYFMTKAQLIEAMEDFPDDMLVRVDLMNGNHYEPQDVTEICPTGTDTSENYLLLS
jgi:uncharacterized protein YlzI (FlbEa/FlbD family)